MFQEQPYNWFKINEHNGYNSNTNTHTLIHTMKYEFYSIIDSFDDDDDDDRNPFFSILYIQKKSPCFVPYIQISKYQMNWSLCVCSDYLNIWLKNEWKNQIFFKFKI